jgi:AcrR family transcriptional regulator
MGRKSLKSQRREQILGAFERCIVRFGLQGASLQKTADKAGVARSILRHYIGNRSDLLRALLKRLQKRYIQGLFSKLSNSTSVTLPDDIVDYLFEESFAFSDTDETVLRAMIEATARDADLRNEILDMYQTYEDDLTMSLVHAFPHASVSKCRSVAHIAIIASHGNYSLSWLGFDRNRYPYTKDLIKSLFDDLVDGQLE